MLKNKIGGEKLGFLLFYDFGYDLFVQLSLFNGD